MNYFSKNIKFLREERKWGQAELARQLNVTRDNVASYERGSIPKLEVLVKIVNLFHIELNHLVEKDLEAMPLSPMGAADPGNERYHRAEPNEELTLESLQKLVKVQEKYIRALEEKIEAGTKGSH